MGFLFYFGAIVAICALVLFIVVVIAVIDHYFFVQKRVQKASAHEATPLTARGFSKKKIPDSIDAIVIGSGIGGLTTGALLARRGKRVLVLEQHDKLGGCTHSFDEKGFEFDSGLHYVGGEVGDSTSQIGFIFDLLSGGELKWTKMDSVYDIAAVSPLLAAQTACAGDERKDHEFRMEYNEKLEITLANLHAKYPDEKDGIQALYRLIHWSQFAAGFFFSLKILPPFLVVFLKRLFGWLFLDPFVYTSTKDVISSCVRSKELRGVLTWLWGDYGTPPCNAPFLMHAVVADHYMKGAFYPTGGPSRIVETFMKIIESTGGALLARARVSRIILSSDGTTAIGVSVKGEDIYCPLIISGAGAINTYTKLLSNEGEDGQKSVIADRARTCFLLPVDKPTAAAAAAGGTNGAEGGGADNNDTTTTDTNTDTPPVVDKLQPSCAMISVFVGLEGTTEELKLPAANTWLFPGWDHDKNALRYYESVRDAGRPSIDTQEGAAGLFLPCVFVGSASAKDSDWENRHPGKSVCELLTVVDYHQFNDLVAHTARSHTPQHRGKAYDTAKELIQQRLLDVLNEQWPQLTSKIVHVSTGTPVTNNFYIGTQFGEVYGLDHTMSRFSEKYEWLLKPKQEIKGLWLTGQDVMSDGICGALGGGILCAIAIDKMVAVDISTSYLLERK